MVQLWKAFLENFLSQFLNCSLLILIHNFISKKLCLVQNSHSYQLNVNLFFCFSTREIELNKTGIGRKAKICRNSAPKIDPIPPSSYGYPSIKYQTSSSNKSSCSPALKHGNPDIVRQPLRWVINHLIKQQPCDRVSIDRWQYLISCLVTTYLIYLRHFVVGTLF